MYWASYQIAVVNVGSFGISSQHVSKKGSFRPKQVQNFPKKIKKNFWDQKYSYLSFQNSDRNRLVSKSFGLTFEGVSDFGKSYCKCHGVLLYRQFYFKLGSYFQDFTLCPYQDLKAFSIGKGSWPDFMLEGVLYLQNRWSSIGTPFYSRSRRACFEEGKRSKVT